MFMPAHLTLLEGSVEDVYGFVGLELEVVLDYLGLHRVAVLQNHGVLDCAKLLLNFDAMKTNGIVFAARRQGHLFISIA